MEIVLKYNVLAKYIYPDLAELCSSEKESSLKTSKRIRSSRNNNNNNNEVKSENDFSTLLGLTEDEQTNIDIEIQKEFSYKQEYTNSNTKKKKKKVARDLKLTLTEYDFLLFEKLSKHQNDIINKNNDELFISDMVFSNCGASGYICGFCFKCFKDPFQFDYHCQINGCPLNFFKTKELKEKIYDDSVIYIDKSLHLYIRRLDGLLDPVICENLTKLGKIFITHKLNNGDDIIKFEFFLVYEKEKFIGYFSREKNSTSWNLSCILTIPKDKKGGKNDHMGINEINPGFQYGQFLIHFSYQLSILQWANFGTPEKPFSDLGLLAYRKYYKFRLMKFLVEDINIDECELAEVSFWEISKKTGMVKNDLIFALESLGNFEYSSSLKKLKIKTSLIAKWEKDESYKEWVKTIASFDVNNFTKLFKFSLKEVDENVLVNKNAEFIQKKIDENSKKDWEIVSIPTERYFYPKVDSKTHESYIQTL